MDLEQIDIRALERVSPRTTLMAPEQVLRLMHRSHAEQH